MACKTLPRVKLEMVEGLFSRVKKFVEGGNVAFKNLKEEQNSKLKTGLRYVLSILYEMF